MDEKVEKILEKFSDFLEITNPITYMLRWIGWMIINGLAWLVDSLSNITDSILGLKTFFDDSEITDFVETLIPLSAVLMGFSLLYTGYKLIFYKKVDREAIVVNIFLILCLFALVGEGMEKANRFTDKAIDALEVLEEGSISQKVIKDNMTDLALFDENGWKNSDLDQPNKIPESKIQKINITQAIDKDFKFAGENKEISEIGREVFDSRLEYDDVGNPKKVDLDNGWFNAFKEKYYRWDWNFWTIAITLGITAFTLLTISVKLSKLFFELAFNYVLVVIVAPADIHSGQKIKQVLQSIMNIFLVTIMVFLSMKIYLLGTSFITEKLDGVAYLVALFAFSVAVVDGPNIVERLFGIDAGLKSGWGALAGAYAGARGVSKGLQGLSSSGKSAALKGLNGIAGVAKGKPSNNPVQSKNGNYNPDEREGSNKNSQSKSNQQKKNLAYKEGDKENYRNKPSESEFDSDASEEIGTGIEEVASSLEQEMKEAEQSRYIERNNLPGFNQEDFSMGKQKKSLKEPNLNSVDIGNEMDRDDVLKMQALASDNNQSSDPSHVISSPGYSSVPSELVEESNELSLPAEERNEQANRYAVRSIPKKKENTQSFKMEKNFYQLNQNTNEDLRKNIINHRQKYRNK